MKTNDEIIIEGLNKITDDNDKLIAAMLILLVYSFQRSKNGKGTNNTTGK